MTASPGRMPSLRRNERLTLAPASRFLLVVAIAALTIFSGRATAAAADSASLADGFWAQSVPSAGKGDSATPDHRTAAIDCLAKAVAYEAGNEPAAGQQAVAQVILNRVGHRAFPKTVCGVVYQGSQRRTGCQFTFTCDGSLRRSLSRRTWDQALTVAVAAIDGALPPTVGLATHYHADYVSPRWAPALVRVGSIGAHIFYRFPGAGSAAAGTIATHRGNPGRRARPGAAVFSVWGLTAATLRPGLEPDAANPD